MSLSTRPPPWTLIKKRVDQTVNNSTTLQNDNELKFVYSANISFSWRLFLVYDTPATADFKLQLIITPGVVISSTMHYAIAPSATAFENIGTQTAGIVALSILSAAGTRGFFNAQGIFTSSLSSSFLVQWAQNTAVVGNTTVLKGSYLEFFPA